MAKVNDSNIILLIDWCNNSCRGSNHTKYLGWEFNIDLSNFGKIYITILDISLFDNFLSYTIDKIIKNKK